MNRRSIRPARRVTTHVETLHGELCVYEWTTKTVHALNAAAARVWEMCDGTTTIDEMIARVHRDGEPGAVAIVEHALVQFDRAGLLEPGTWTTTAPLVSRRALLRRIGVAAAIPIVTSIVAPTPLAAQSSNPRQFDFTGAAQSFTVPAGVTTLQVDAYGATGGRFSIFEFGAWPGRVQAALPVTPGEILTIMIGSMPSALGVGGFNGGGSSGVNSVYGGGGAADIRRGSTRVIVAGGGGGTGPNPVIGGLGGGLIAGSGTGSSCGGGGGGGTQSAGGVGGAGGGGGAAGSPGASGQGGNGGDGVVPSAAGGSGGGGGYFGGGGGGACGTPPGGGPGGGGSSYTDPSATSVVHWQGYVQFAHARIRLSW